MLVRVLLLVTVLEFPCLLADIAIPPTPPAPTASDFVINDRDIKLMFKREHNRLRIGVANGYYFEGITYGPASNMYRLGYSESLAEIAHDELYKQYATAVELGRNYFSRVIYKGRRLDFEAKEAVQQWMQNSASFAQMILAKATGLGCAHKLSNVENDNNGMLLEMLCIYNERYYEGYPYTKGAPCQKDSDCTTYQPSTCYKKYHVCDRK